MRYHSPLGTETGNAEMLAEDVTAHLEGDHDVDLHQPLRLRAGRLRPPTASIW